MITESPPPSPPNHTHTFYEYVRNCNKSNEIKGSTEVKGILCPPPPTTDYDFDFGEGFFIFDCQDVLGVSATPHPPSPLQLLSKTMLRA